MKRYLTNPLVTLAVITTGLFPVQLAVDEIRDPEVAFFEETFGDMTEELAAVSEEGKTALLIMFETDDCPWCMRMKQTVLNHARVQDYYREHFKILKLNAEGGAPIVDFTGKEVSETQFATELLRVRATPCLRAVTNVAFQKRLQRVLIIARALPDAKPLNLLAPDLSAYEREQPDYDALTLEILANHPLLAQHQAQNQAITAQSEVWQSFGRSLP